MLPKVEYPIYEIYVKSVDRKVKFRPFLVKEEKILLMAKEAEDESSINLAVNQIINNCLEEPLDVASLPMFDIEMIFLKLRAKSVGESVKLAFNCKNEVDGVECNTDTDYTINLENIGYTVPEEHEPKIMINDKIGLVMRYPNLKNMPVVGDDDEFTIMLTNLVNCIDYVFNGDSVYKIEDATPEEQAEFIESFSAEAMEKIQAFFRSTPKVVLNDVVKCKKCGFEHKLYAEDLLSFFV